MNFLKPYIKKYAKPFSVGVLFLTFEAICDLMQPTIMSKIIDIGVANQDLNYVFKMGGLMLLITAFGALSASVRNVVASNVSQNFGMGLRSDLFRKIQSLSARNLDKFDSASLITRLTNDVTQVQVFTNGLMRIFVKAPLLCLGGLIMATRLNSQLAVVLAIVVPIVALLIVINMRVGFPFFKKVQKALDRVNGVMREYLSGVRVVKAFNRFDYEVNKFNGANEEFQSTSIAATRVMAVFSPAIMLTVNIGIVVVLWVGGVRVSEGHMQVGHIIAFTNYMTQILFSLMLISMVFNMFVRARASAARIGEVFAEENQMTWSDQLPATTTRGRIDFEQVCFSYDGEPVLKNITLTCLPGETVGIIGSTGSGKSSMVSLLPRFYDVNSGSIQVDGVNIQHLDPKKLREKIAIVPQKTTLFTGSILENIKWGNENATQAEIERAAQMAQAHDFIANTPDGYHTRLGQGGVNLSGGQKQRVSIARALVRNPEILILDDSTSAVDVATEARIKEALKTYARGLTCLLIAQRITSVIDADKIVVLDQGEIVGTGTHEELMKTCDVYQQIFQSQVGKEVQADV
ncbi:ABC transporter ATP-binding protein [Tumebacillus permanentifrigoris]|uniref:ATP-binding cassette subfamily B protein n=1 Tax=Tumebacillus permanentifrigoris TaxID=378543 RepID=A0A316DE54_9BACL|nr:ABC transporter ATP-binding protein [Tumebacillus permanentifrigoris]PWK16507.1 ATP-binding cassette subfamily B protein [Tumebacillus permanentifrigoris]